MPEDQEDLKVEITDDSFKITGRIKEKYIYIFLALIAAALGVSYDEIAAIIGGL